MLSPVTKIIELGASPNRELELHLTELDDISHKDWHSTRLWSHQGKRASLQIAIISDLRLHWRVSNLLYTFEDFEKASDCKLRFCWCLFRILISYKTMRVSEIATGVHENRKHEKIWVTLNIPTRWVYSLLRDILWENWLLWRDSKLQQGLPGVRFPIRDSVSEIERLSIHVFPQFFISMFDVAVDIEIKGHQKALQEIFVHFNSKTWSAKRMTNTLDGWKARVATKVGLSSCDLVTSSSTSVLISPDFSCLSMTWPEHQQSHTSEISNNMGDDLNSASRGFCRCSFISNLRLDTDDYRSSL